MIVRTLSVGLVHTADAAAKDGNIAAVERAHFVALLLQGLRIAIPAALLIAIPASDCSRRSWFDARLVERWYGCRWWYGRSRWLRYGYQHDGNREVWPFFAIGFALAAISQLTLIALWCHRCCPCLHLP